MTRGTVRCMPAPLIVWRDWWGWRACARVDFARVCFEPSPLHPLLGECWPLSWHIFEQLHRSAERAVARLYGFKVSDERPCS